MSHALFWFRRDLRLSDNPGLNAAAQAHRLTCVFVLDEHLERPIGGASRWWLHHSLERLQAQLNQRRVPLVLLRGRADETLPKLCGKLQIDALHFTHLYHSEARSQEDALNKALSKNTKWCGHHVDTLFHPEDIRTNSGTPYKVFTPFWRSMQEKGLPTDVVATATLSGADHDEGGDRLEDWDLLPTQPNWAKAFPERWTPGEEGGEEKLAAFCEGGVNAYDDERNRPDIHGTSRLSPHLHWGEISPRQVVKSVEAAGGSQKQTYLSEIAWREFGRHLVWHQPDFGRENFQRKFDDFEWRDDGDALHAWQRGRTGYPIVDAGMRELWQTGWMHNRVRMITASFLTKHLLIHWREGEAWFWDTLVDADPASNAMGWQWVAGTGADAAPYFRVFNPITQGEKFDPDGSYTRRFVPELAQLPDKYLFAPWQAPKNILQNAGVSLGETYPQPLIEHKQGRERALEAYKNMRGGQAES